MHARLSAFLPLDEDAPLPPDCDRPASSAADIEHLYRTERPGLLRFLARATSPDHGEDIVQRLFARLIARAHTPITQIESPAAYLRQAARNMLRDEAKAEARQGRSHHVPLESAAPSPVDPVTALEARDRLARLEQAVMRLKPLTRQIFLARRLDGFSYAEIAERTGLSVRGVEKQMNRAIKQLGRHLRSHD